MIARGSPKVARVAIQMTDETNQVESQLANTTTWAYATGSRRTYIFKWHLTALQTLK